MEKPSIGPFLMDTSFYKKHRLDELRPIILDILFFNGAIDCFCPKCNSHSIFQGENDDNDHLQRKANLSLSGMHPGLSKPTDYTGTYPLDFYCTRDRTHKLNFIFKVDQETLFKIGQSPSELEIVRGDYKQYKKLLGEQFDDLNSAVILHSSNFGIASFTHLRRIIENFFMVEAFRVWSENNDPLPAEELNKMKFKERMSLVKEYLPEALTENPSLYSIVSSGIHGLSEDTCRAYYHPVKECILLSLDEIVSEQRKKKSRETIQKELNAIASGMKSDR